MTGLRNILVAVTGASGTIYARQLLEHLFAAAEPHSVIPKRREESSLYLRRFCKKTQNQLLSTGYAQNILFADAEPRLLKKAPQNFLEKLRFSISPMPATDEAAEKAPQVGRIGLIISRYGREVAAWEGVDIPEHPTIEKFENDDMFSSPASGSARWDAMVVVPASMGSIGRIAAGVSTDLISRAADVMLKEGRQLIVVPRETPLSLIHLRNLTTLAEAGAVVLPAAPSFYSRPEDIEALAATVTERIVARLGIDTPRYEWARDGK